MFSSNDTKAAYRRWQGMGPSGPYNEDLVREYDKELLEHLAEFMFNEGIKFTNHLRNI